MTERRWRRRKVCRRRRQGEDDAKLESFWRRWPAGQYSLQECWHGNHPVSCWSASSPVSQSVSQSWGRDQTVLDRLSWMRRNKERNNNKKFSKACLKEKSTARIFFWEMYFLLELTSLVVNVRIFNMYLSGSSPTPRGCKKRIYLFIEPALSLLTFDLCLREALSSTGHLMILTLCNQIHSCL